MSTADELALAKGGETIRGTNLQPAIDALLATAKSLDADIAAAPDVESVQAIGLAQADLNNQAMSLVTAQITLLAGQVKINADQINAAAEYVQKAVAEMADWKKKVAAIGKVVDFCAALGTGNGGKILQSALQLKDAL